MPAQESTVAQVQQVAGGMRHGDVLDYPSFERRALQIGCYDASDAARRAIAHGGRAGYLTLLNFCGVDTRA